MTGGRSEAAGVMSGDVRISSQQCGSLPHQPNNSRWLHSSIDILLSIVSVHNINPTTNYDDMLSANHAIICVSYLLSLYLHLAMLC